MLTMLARAICKNKGVQVLQQGRDQVVGPAYSGQELELGLLQEYGGLYPFNAFNAFKLLVDSGELTHSLTHSLCSTREGTLPAKSEPYLCPATCSPTEWYPRWRHDPHPSPRRVENTWETRSRCEQDGIADDIMQRYLEHVKEGPAATAREDDKVDTYERRLIDIRMQTSACRRPRLRLRLRLPPLQRYLRATPEEASARAEQEHQDQEEQSRSTRTKRSRHLHWPIESSMPDISSRGFSRFC